MSKVHLVTYATRRFRLRQKLLGWSALANGVVDSVEEWEPGRLEGAGFGEFACGISLNERGSGFWAWKPFIIKRRLREVCDGDLVLYADVGRLYPFKLLQSGMDPLLEWLEAQRQEVLPGVLIPWDGSVGEWTKRKALRELGMDRAEVHGASPVQASFSLWRAGRPGREFAGEWATLCAHRDLVSDDSSDEELPVFRAHRHDQALLTLLCLRRGLAALDLGPVRPDFDERNPSAVAAHLAGLDDRPATVGGRCLRTVADAIALAERTARRFVKFGKPIDE